MAPYRRLGSPLWPPLLVLALALSTLLASCKEAPPPRGDATAPDSPGTQEELPPGTSPRLLPATPSLGLDEVGSLAGAPDDWSLLVIALDGTHSGLGFPLELVVQGETLSLPAEGVKQILLEGHDHYLAELSLGGRKLWLPVPIHGTATLVEHLCCGVAYLEGIVPAEGVCPTLPSGAPCPEGVDEGSGGCQCPPASTYHRPTPPDGFTVCPSQGSYCSYLPRFEILREPGGPAMVYLDNGAGAKVPTIPLADQGEAPSSYTPFSPGQADILTITDNLYEGSTPEEGGPYWYEDIAVTLGRCYAIRVAKSGVTFVEETGKVLATTSDDGTTSPSCALY